MIVARSVVPQTGSRKDGSHKDQFRYPIKGKQREPTPALATFESLAAARSWLAEQSDARAALVYIEYGPGDA